MMTAEHPVHDALPSGFQWANDLQAEEFKATGSVNGASKVCLVSAEAYPYLPSVVFTDTRISVIEGSISVLAVRLRPPRTWEDVHSIARRTYRAEELLTRAQRAVARDWYIAEYNNGWSAGGRGNSSAWDSGNTSHAWDDGYLDRAAGRAKWHLTYCTNHDNCGEA